MFSANSFSPASFSIQSFKMVQQDQARSGYWRLFFTEMQEKSLEDDRRKREQEQRQEAPQGTVEVTETEPVAKPKPKPRTAKPVRRVERVIETLPIHPRPVYNSPQPAIDFVTPFLRIVSNEFYLWQQSSEPIVAAMLQRKAANDEDEEDSIHLLLMAA